MFSAVMPRDGRVSPEATAVPVVAALGVHSADATMANAQVSTSVEKSVVPCEVRFIRATTSSPLRHNVRRRQWSPNELPVSR